MTDLRTAAQQALEALVSENSFSAVAMQQRMGAIRALKTALAQQAEPVDTDCHTQGICQRSGYGITQQAEPVEPVAHRVVAGALFDFMGWLTSRRERLVLSSSDDAAPAADAIKDFAEMRGLSMNNAQVQEWQDNVTAPPRRLPLTEKALDALFFDWASHCYGSPVVSHRRFARAVEAAHGIGRQTDPQIEDRLARHGIPKP